MIFRRRIEDPSQWTKFFCWYPVQEVILKEDRSALVLTYWLTTIERRLISNTMTGIKRWDYRKSSTSDDGISSI